MLIQSSFPCSIEAASFHVSDHGKQHSECDWLPATETRQMCPKYDEHCHSSCRKSISVTVDKQNADFSCPLNFGRNSQHSIVSTMSESTAPNFVYRRRKLRGNAAIISVQDPLNMKRTDDCLSVASSNALSVATKEQHIVSQAEEETVAVGASVMVPNSEPYLLRSDSVQGEAVSNGPPKSSKHKMVEVHSINDSCSSSKSNMELVSAFPKTEVDDTAECSSSSVIGLEEMAKDLSEKDLCISILKSEGLLERFCPSQTRESATGMEKNSSSSSSCSRSCKICRISETSLQLLICDNCEKAFHPSCCNPRIKTIPIDEWFCNSCMKKKHKILKEMNIRKSPNIISELGRCRKASSKGDSYPIELILRDNEMYNSGVRVGKGFQAEVPDWLGPINSDVDTIGEPLELDLSVGLNLQELKSTKPSKLSSIGNWLQCRQVVEGINEDVDGTICGKWRRAPLFEVQTDDWECFCSIHWDPTHADCAAPQELETEQVLKQLRYIEKLRPLLAAKRRKLDRPKSSGLEEGTENLSNVENQDA